jgi:hypothetical protein
VTLHQSLLPELSKTSTNTSALPKSKRVDTTQEETPFVKELTKPSVPCYENAMIAITRMSKITFQPWHLL